MLSFLVQDHSLFGSGIYHLCKKLLMWPKLPAKCKSSNYQAPNIKSKMVRQAHHPGPSRRVNPKKQIQNSQLKILILFYWTASQSADLGLRSDSLQLTWMFWSFDIEFWKLFVIWCLRFGIYKTLWRNLSGVWTSLLGTVLLLLPKIFINPPPDGQSKIL